MPLHRLTTPTYFGGLPVGYDYLNTPSDPSVGGSGVPALVDAIKSGGPNDGTYFVAFGEDARSSFANRGLGALGQNTDFLDDVLRTSIPVFSFADATAVGAVTTHALVGQIYVGETGTVNNQANRDKIIRVTDQSNNDLEVSGTKIVATLIHDGASTNVVGTEASGFRTNASVNFTPSIPDTTTYRVWFGTRDNITNITAVNKGALFEEQMRTINNVSGEVRSLLRQVHSEAIVNQAWDAAFDSTIRSLAASGLNERYRRARLQPAGFVTGDFDVAGGGAIILRDGQAVTLKADEFGLTGLAWPDGNHALLKLVPESNRSQNGSAASGGQAGDIGIWHESEWKALVTAADAGMFWRDNSAGPALVEVIPYDMRATTFNGDSLFTFINASSATAIINPDSGSGTTARQTIECGAGQHFALTTPTRTAIRVGLDLLEVTDSSNRVRTFVIVEILSATRVRVLLPTGGSPLFSTTAEPGVTLRFIQTMVRIGGALGRDGGAVNTLLSRPIIAIPPAILTNDVAGESIAPCSFFGAQTGSVTDATSEARRARALEWGSTASPDSGGTVDGNITARGWLNGDGSAHITRLIGTTSITSGLSVGGTLGVTGATTLSTLAVTGDATVGDDLAVAQDLTVGDDITVASDATVANRTTTGFLAINQPDRFIEVREDWHHFIQEFTPDLIHADELWQVNQILDVFTLNNGTPSVKNPGRLEIIGAGGSTSRELAIFKTTLLPVGFSNLEMMTITVKVNQGAGNLAESIGIGLVDNTVAQNGGNDSLILFHSASAANWRLIHRVGGANGAHNNFVLAAFVNDQFIVFRLIKNAAGDLDIFIDDNPVAVLTIAVANIPTGNGTINAYVVQSVADPDPTTWTWDFVAVRGLTAASRSGA